MYFAGFVRTNLIKMVPLTHVELLPKNIPFVNTDTTKAHLFFVEDQLNYFGELDRDLSLTEVVQHCKKTRSLQPNVGWTKVGLAEKYSKCMCCIFSWVADLAGTTEDEKFSDEVDSDVEPPKSRSIVFAANHLPQHLPSKRQTKKKSALRQTVSVVN